MQAFGEDRYALLEILATGKHYVPGQRILIPKEKREPGIVSVLGKLELRQLSKSSREWLEFTIRRIILSDPSFGQVRSIIRNWHIGRGQIVRFAPQHLELGGPDAS